MKLSEVVELTQSLLPPPQLEENFSVSLLERIANRIIRVKIVPRLLHIGGYFYLGDLTNVESNSLTETGDTYKFALSGLSNTPYMESISAWVDDESIDTDEYMDYTPVKLTAHPAIERLIHYDSAVYADFVYGEIDNGEIRIHNSNYEYICIKYVQQPSTYASGDTIDLDDFIVDGLVVPAVCEQAVIKDKGQVSSAEYRREYLSNLQELQKRIRRKRRHIEITPPNYGSAEYEVW